MFFNFYLSLSWYLNFQRFCRSSRDGKEIITRYTFENINNKDVFYTDSNGREQIKRILNKRNDYEYTSSDEPVANNYYPVTTKIVIKDEIHNIEAAVLNDRAEGGTSLNSGVIELMLHRRLLRDDGYGVNEALKEDEYGKGLYARGQHWLTFGPICPDNKQKSSVAVEKALAHKKLLSPLVFLSEATEELKSLDSVLDLINFKASILQNMK